MLILPRVMYEQALSHLRDCYPEEGCGFLAGRNNQIAAVYPVSNLLHSLTAYRMDPAGQLAALLAIEEASWELIAIYHSHPQGPQRPSPSDIAQWHYPEAAMIIISLADGKRPSAHAYRLAQGRATDYPLLIV
jgi:[CysO sulfur-carrier protein]-S-L-cysteine hydrolase